jgi:hypothetical protein
MAVRRHPGPSQSRTSTRSRLRDRTGTLAIAAVFAIAAGIGQPPTAGAVVPLPIYPTRTDDPSSGGTDCSPSPVFDTDCSLRNALIHATVDGETVSLAPPAPAGPYEVTQNGAPLEISHNTKLVGTGARTTTIERGSNLGGVLAIDGAVTGATIQGVTISGGGPSGGGIENAGTLTIRDSALDGNGSDEGGGVYSSGTLTVIGSTMTDNFADASESYGGGAMIASGTASFVNSTIAENSAVANSGTGFAFGGGIAVGGLGTASLANVTLFSNDATGAEAGTGGNLYADPGGSISAKDTIITLGGPENCAEAITSQGYNLENRNQCGLTGTGDETNLDPLLGALQDNGGETDTLAPAAASPAVDHGNPAGCTDPLGTPLTTDQRGSPRPVGAACDIGAVELPPPPNTKITHATIDAALGKARFRFKAIGVADGFQCELAPTETAFSVCSSPKTYRHLAPDNYTFKVRATGLGGIDPTPAKMPFQIP